MNKAKEKEKKKEMEKEKRKERKGKGKGKAKEKEKKKEKYSISVKPNSHFLPCSFTLCFLNRSSISSRRVKNCNVVYVDFTSMHD